MTRRVRHFFGVRALAVFDQAELPAALTARTR
jgi:hypothetical protein